MEHTRRQATNGAELRAVFFCVQVCVQVEVRVGRVRVLWACDLCCQRYVPHDLAPPVSTACAHAPTREVALVTVALEGSGLGGLGGSFCRGQLAARCNRSPTACRESMWVAGRRGDVAFSGEQLSTAACAPDVDAPARPWMPAQVPGTVLTSLILNGDVPDPNIGLNSLQVPDIGDVGPEAYTFWFCAQAQLDLHDGSKGSGYWQLELEGINYSFELFLNGAPVPVSCNKGMFARHIIDVSSRVCHGPNFFAILVYPPDHPGMIPANGGQGGDHAIAQDVASQFVEGWDWTIAVADRCTGIWGDVSLRQTGCLRLAAPYAAPSLSPEAIETVTQNPRKSVSANIRSYVTVTNGSAEETSGVLTLQIEHVLASGAVMVDVLISETITVPAGASIEHAFAPQTVTNAALWWPINMGDQPLYTMSVQVALSAPDRKGGAKGGGGAEEIFIFGGTRGPWCGAPISDSCEVRFGVRGLDSYIDPATGGRVFAVNGHPVFIRGANYICSDFLLRQPAARIWQEVRLHATAGLNMLRCWGGAGCQGQALYEACDALGVLVWVEFWITADNDGAEGGAAGNPLDHELFLHSAARVIRDSRAHPSVTVYVGGNEQRPCAELDAGLASLVGSLAAGRPYVSGSVFDGFADGCGGHRPNSEVFWDGPYGPQDPRVFFDADFYAFGFNPELGSVGLPVYETLCRALPGDMSQMPVFKPVTAPGGTVMLSEEVSQAYAHHCYMSYGDPGNNVPDQIAVYGTPTTLEDYCTKAQLANFVQYRALVEGLSSRMWAQHTGFLIWKTQNPWFGFRGQMYDWLLEPNAALYGIRCATEPVHVQLCPREGGKVQVVNTTLQAVAVTVTVRGISLQSEPLYCVQVLLENVFSCCRMCSLAIECVLLL